MFDVLVLHFGGYSSINMDEKDERDPAALHVIVVGFHHKKGMQVKSIILYCNSPSKLCHKVSIL